jgi:ABC-type uncharacterized transport system involved in gliding motility auxiliary subunit
MNKLAVNQWSGFLGILGLVALLFGVSAGLVLGFTWLPIVLHFVVGGSLIAIWFFSRGSKNLGQGGKVGFGRAARFSLNAGLYTAVFVGLLGVVYWFSHRYDRRWDLTESGVYSLTPQSTKLIEGLSKPLKLVAFTGSPQVSDNEIEELLALYRYHNSAQVKTEIVNPRTKPHLVDVYEMKEGNLLYIEYGEGDQKAVSRINQVSEEALTNAVIKLTRGASKKIYFVTGHGESSLEDQGQQGLSRLKGALTDEHLTAEEIVLGQKESVPSDAAAVILVAPKRPLLPQEREMLITYAEQGGRLMLFGDPRTSSDVRELAAHFGVQIDNTVVVDLVQRLFAAPALGVQLAVTDYGAHPITSNLERNGPTILSLTASVRPMSEVPGSEGKSVKDATYTVLLKSKDSAWGESNLEALFNPEGGTASKDPEDAPGPIGLAVAYEKKIAASGSAEGETAQFQKMTRVVVLGSGSLLENPNIELYANRDFTLNAVNWLAGEEGGITVARKSMRASTAVLTDEQFKKILVSSLLIPELILLTGLLVWWRRKMLGAALS